MALLEVGMYTAVEVLDAVIVRTHASDQRYDIVIVAPMWA